MTDHDDDLLRDALRAEADDVVATDELLDRIRSSSPSESPRGALAPWLLAAATVVGVVGLAFMITQGDDDQTLDAVDDPSTTTTPAPTTTDADGEPPGERPTLVALVREDGWLVTVDLASGVQRELLQYEDPRQERPEGGPNFIDSVDLSPDGQWIYFSTCCEPAVGVSFRIPVTGGEPEQVGYGAFPRVSPDGTRVAMTAGPFISVHEISNSGVSNRSVDHEILCCASRLSWSPDGSQLAYVSGAGSESGDAQVHVLSWLGTVMREVEMDKPDNPGWFASWTPGGTSVVTDGEPIADDRSLSQDSSYRWLLWVDEAGVVREQAGFESGDRMPIEGLPRALSADW